ncbi:macro domain-containing protein [Micromonospora sp. NPDC050397]|uniref:macro domain-containing protein n=1 Tax=Micromonospora sp. NPDC050397 TaxID=3364279 RepID=UPI00384FED87
MIEVDGVTHRLTPKAMVVLIRLVVAEGQPVTVEELFRDVWGLPGVTVRRADRVSVQKRISELRACLDPLHPGEDSRVLITERAQISAYRLVLPAEQVDVFRFRRMVMSAQGLNRPEAMVELRTALDLWRGTPLSDAVDARFAVRLVRQLEVIRTQARRDLVRLYADLGLLDRAFDLGIRLWSDDPDNVELRSELDVLARRMRSRTETRGGIGRRFENPAFQVSVLSGDLFVQDDAHLVVGFSDTFDTSVRDDHVISRRSVQGQLLNEFYGGDQASIDRALRSALGRIAPLKVESRRDKRRGKLVRYPLGTVAVLSHSARRIFAVAYSSMGNDLVAQSTLDDLRIGLDNAWNAVARYGQLRPVAMPIVGSGLARVMPGESEELLEMIVESFVRRSREGLISPELRIVVPPDKFDKIDALRAVAFLNSL